MCGVSKQANGKSLVKSYFDRCRVFKEDSHAFTSRGDVAQW